MELIQAFRTKKHANYLDHIPVGGAKTTCLHFATG